MYAQVFSLPCSLLQSLVGRSAVQRSTLSKCTQETAGLLLAQGADPLPLYHVPPHLLEPPTTFTVRPYQASYRNEGNTIAQGRIKAAFFGAVMTA
jgi:hypothetical protein